MLFLNHDLIPRKRLNEDLFDFFSFGDIYKPKKRLLSPDEELVVTSPKKRKTNNNCDKFEVKLDVNHFRPEEINIKVIENNLIVEGKHDERQEENGFVSRQFTRRYEMPKNVDLDVIMSSLSKEGKLTIEAPIKQKVKERVIPISVENSKPKLTTQITLAEDNDYESGFESETESRHSVITSCDKVVDKN